jgi:SHAQKYF class myb-like DNA-binding protein
MCLCPQSRFLDAVALLGIRATATEILKRLDVPGVMRDHVASHLQQHRNMLKKLAGECSRLLWT